jgi:hypothetical protein
MPDRGLLALLSAATIVAGPLAAGAAERQAPPTLTPLVARDVAYACPGTERYAEALVRGITEREAASAAPLFDACAAGAKRDYGDYRRHAASTAVGAAYLSLGLLRHDPALLRRAIDATAEQRRDVTTASDQDIRRWPVIPDEYDARRDCPSGTEAIDAAYINVAAHAGTAWVTAPRAAAPCPAVRPDVYLASRGFPGPEPSRPGPNYAVRPYPAIEPDLNNGQPLTTQIGGH